MKSIIWGTPDCDLSHSYIALGCMIWKTLNDDLVICYHMCRQKAQLLTAKRRHHETDIKTRWRNILKRHEKTIIGIHADNCRYHLIPSHTNLFSSGFMRLQAASVCNCHFLIYGISDACGCLPAWSAGHRRKSRAQMEEAKCQINLS